MTIHETAKTERDPLSAAIQIGTIADCPWHYTTGLAKLVDASGKLLHELTIGELLQIDKEYGRKFEGACERLINARFHFIETIDHEAQS